MTETRLNAPQRTRVAYMHRRYNGSGTGLELPGLLQLRRRLPCTARRHAGWSDMPPYDAQCMGRTNKQRWSHGRGAEHGMAGLQ